MQPAGGTEIQLEYLKKFGAHVLLDNVQITTSVPEKDPLHPLRSNIIWLKNNYNQPNLFDWFREPKNHDRYDWYVFNSNWSYEKYRMYFNIPTHKSLVIKNGIDYSELKIKKKFKYKKPLKLVYMSTPWRGLDVALEAMKRLEGTKDVILDVYSSTIIYGDDFQRENDKNYIALYDKAKKLKNVNYRGYVPHKQLMALLHNYDVNIHPSTWEETFCISAVESLAAGLMLITTNYGALFETCAEFPVYINYTDDKEKLVELLVQSILQTKEIFENVDLSSSLIFQQQYYKRFYDWNHIRHSWNRFLKGAIYEKKKDKKLKRR